MAKVTSVREVTLTLSEREASELKTILMDQVDWESDRFGRVASVIYDALDDADVSEA